CSSDGRCRSRCERGRKSAPTRPYNPQPSRCPMKFLAAAAFAALALPHVLAPHVLAQLACTGTPLTGVVHDSTQAIIPGALLTLDSGPAATSSSDGHFRFACVPEGSHHLSVAAPGFATQTVTLRSPHPASL